MRGRTGILALFLAALFTLSGLTAAAEELDQHGKAHAWSGPSDGYTIIDFAASWCRPCWVVLPRLEAYAKEHPDVRVIVVSIDDDAEGRDALVEKLKLTLPVLWDGERRIAEHYRPKQLPTTYVLDPEGTIVYRHVGAAAREWDELTAFLADATKDRVR